MRERTITINGLSKTYSVTGWRVGYAVAPPRLTDAIRKVHDFLTVGAAAPLQEAGARALALPPSYLEFTRYLVKDVGVAVVPGSSFFHDPSGGSRYIRFCFCKRDETLQAASERLRRIPQQRLAHSR